MTWQSEFLSFVRPSVQAEFNGAVAMLHSFWYEKASETFADVAAKDPTCGIAYWGIAMARYHQIWSAPGPADLKAGVVSLEKAEAAGAKTQRERDYIAGLATFYMDSDKLDHRTRVLAYERAMQRIYEAYPQDREAAAFYALALLASSLRGPLNCPTRPTSSILLLFPEHLVILLLHHLSLLIGEPLWTWVHSDFKYSTKSLFCWSLSPKPNN